MENSTYRPISSYAVAAYCVAPLALAAFAIPEAIAISGIVLILATIASVQIYYYQYAGRRLVITACVAAVFTAIEIPHWHHCNYVSESEPGYRRENFQELVSNKKLGSLVGHPLCLKGQFIYRSTPILIRSQGRPEVQSFHFAPHTNGFGVEPIVRVELLPNTDWSITYTRVAVSGILAENNDWMPGNGEPKFCTTPSFDLRDPKTNICIRMSGKTRHPTAVIESVVTYQ